CGRIRCGFGSVELERLFACYGRSVNHFSQRLLFPNSALAPVADQSGAVADNCEPEGPLGEVRRFTRSVTINALIVIDSEPSAERGSGKSLLPGSGLTFGLPLLIRSAGISRPLFKFVSDTDGVLCVSETICTRALPHTRIHTSAGATTGIGT